MIVLDCVPYFQEERIWRLRYETLRDVVDGFVVVEARQTHSGTPKTLTFERDHAELYAQSDRIWLETINLPDIIYPPSITSIPATRRREMTQRNAIVSAIHNIDISDIAPDADDWRVPDDAILLISDCDEIPRPEAVRAIRQRGLNDGEVLTLYQTLYYYNLNTRSPQPWPGTRAARWADVAALSPHVIRCGLGQPDGLYPVHLGVANAGWHLSYFGGPEMVRRKMESFLHQELRSDGDTDPATLAARINAGEDVWGRPGGAHGITLGPAADLPPPIAADPAAWRDFFHPEYQ